MVVFSAGDQCVIGLDPVEGAVGEINHVFGINHRVLLGW